MTTDKATDDKADGDKSADDRLIVVAQLGGAFGVRGEARVRSFTEDPEACFTYGPLMDAEGAVILTPKSIRPINDGYGVMPVERVQREHWEGMKGVLLHVPRAAMPALTDADDIYVADLIGCTVRHVDGRQLGVVKGAPNFGAGDLLEIQPETGPSFLLPFTLADFPDVDLDARILSADPDEAMLPDTLQQPKP